MRYKQLKNKIINLEREALDSLIERKPSKNDLKDNWLDCYVALCQYRNTNVPDEEDPLYFKMIQVKKLLSLMR